MNNYLIYKITNKINNKSYIGKTNNFNRRMKIHYKSINNDNVQTVFKYALSKYGWNNFDKEILENNLSDEESSIREKYYIKLYNTFINVKSSNGYNMTEGGEGGNTYKCKTKDELLIIRKKISKSNTGENNGMKNNGYKISGEKNGMYGKHHTQEQKNKISEKLKNKYSGENSPNYGKHLSPDIKEKIRKSCKHNGKGKKVVCININTGYISIFQSLTECSKITNLSQRIIKNHIVKKRIINNYKFMFFDKYIIK